MLPYRKIILICLLAAMLSAAMLLPALSAAEDAMETAVPEEPIAWEIGEVIEPFDQVALTITGYETGARFRYYPSGGFSSASLIARRGYTLLCLFVSVENSSDEDFDVAELFGMELTYADYRGEPRDTFFYRMKSGAYAGGVVAILADGAADGCLLFALPEEAEGSRQCISVRFVYGEGTYVCVLRPNEGILLMEEGEGNPF